jgi:alkaline phosphatase D
MFDFTTLRAAALHEGGVSRRLFLAYAGSLAALPYLRRRGDAATRKVSFAADPFSVGVASGDPTPRGVVLWTRLAPKPLEPGGGLLPKNIEVTWEISDDESMRNVVQRGSAVATPQLGHSVHAEVDGLEPDRWYWYRFRAGDANSPIGRTRTVPTQQSSPSELRFAVASCQNYEAGLYTAYEHMAREELDLVLHLGDYIYEYAGKDNLVRKHVGEEIQSLDDYRIRHAQYKSDPLLQAMHARCPWMVIWDDHEFDNNCANDISEEEGVDPVDFLIRRANAYQAYYEMMPLRRRSLPRGPRMQLYRKLSFGRLAEFLMLDTRQHRTDQPNGDEEHDINDAAMSPKASMLGAEQFGWLQKSLNASTASWNVLAQQTMMGMVDLKRGDGRRYSMDSWPGYAYERGRLMEFLANRRVPNPVVLTGDYHANWVNNLRLDDRRPEMPVVATEFVGTSISSDGNGADKLSDWKTATAENACVQFYNAQRGYVRCTVTPGSWRSDFQVVKDISRPGEPITTRASYVIENGEPGAKEA